jgi:hypothetical protein
MVFKLFSLHASPFTPSLQRLLTPLPSHASSFTRLSLRRYGFFGYWRIPLNCFDGSLVFFIMVQLLPFTLT